jgi:hypothetical protein
VQLPNLDTALIEEHKIVEYLLNPRHSEGASKARFFGSLGFSAADWEQLADALRQVAHSWPVTKVMESSHGRKYIIEGVISSPAGRSGSIRTVWITDEANDSPRLVTAYPCE